MRQTAALAVLGCVAALSSGCGVLGSGPAGQVVTYQGYAGTAIVSADGRTITVGEFGTSCPTKVSAVARESVSKVALFLRFSTPRHPPSCPPNAAAGRIPAQAVRLRAPLGSRKLVEGGTDRATAWISAQLILRPTLLPRGYRLVHLIPAVDLAQAQSPGPAGCTQFYQPPNAPAALEIIQTAGPLRQPGLGGAGGTPIRVRGHTGLARHSAISDGITWREEGLTDYILSGVPDPQDSHQLLTTRQLIAIADRAHQSR